MSRSLLAALLALVLLVPAGGLAQDDPEPEATDEPMPEATEEEPTEPVVVMETSRGTIVLRFFPDLAPEHVKNFLALSENGTYAGTLFHRVIPGFMIQGGDPNSKDEDPNNDGMGGVTYEGPGHTLKAEFSDRTHERGILSMARSQDVNSARSQFFIMHRHYPALDGKYTVFGETIQGLDVVDAIVMTPRNNRDRPNEDQKILETTVEYWPVGKVEAAKEALAEAEAARKKAATDN